MRQVLPLRFRRLDPAQLVFGTEAGSLFIGNSPFLERMDKQALTDADIEFLDRRGFISAGEGQLGETAFLHQLAGRLRPSEKLQYVLLVPTLRCDLSCSYCQVSRANISAHGYDWSPDVLARTLEFLDQQGGETIQVEFQGGEPTLRLDRVHAVIEFCRKRFRSTRFVICTNLSEFGGDLQVLLQGEDVHLSTSFDGTHAIHTEQRTGATEATDRFLQNLSAAMETAPGRVHALPTLNPQRLPDPAELLAGFDGLGIHALYLRPIAFHGFARKAHAGSRAHDAQWFRFFDQVVDEIVRWNDERETKFEEVSLTLALRRLLRPGVDTHADLRSPNWLGYDHLVVDYDGTLYPTDEARMLARSGIVDLSIGDVSAGIDEARRHALQGRAFNALDPWCSQCPYQAACGSDPIDDIARSGRADTPRPHTAFCKRQTHIFDLAVQLLQSDEVSVQRSIAHWLNLPGPTRLLDRCG